MMQKIVLILLRIYRCAISPFVPTQCRYVPTCSCYMEQAIAEKGLRTGLWLGTKRILRCNPFFPGGYDPLQ
jgi:putative membrane protein insertion efficiency factor